MDVVHNGIPPQWAFFSTLWSHRSSQAIRPTMRPRRAMHGPPVLQLLQMCSTHWVSPAEKADYLMVKSLRGKSGWGWNDDNHVIIVDDDVWAEFLKTSLDAKKWRTKPYSCGQSKPAYFGSVGNLDTQAGFDCLQLYHFYDEMADLIDGGVATGTNSSFPLCGEGGIAHPPSQEDPIDWPLTDKEDSDDKPQIIEVNMSSSLVYQVPEIKNITMTGVHHLYAADSNMARFVKADSHSGSIWIFILKNL
ncbi:hypothetical protein C8R44DRAFT_888163 [Mycena epipterygia]|nr:hypothetical protein C8R44DRAFT_888163 [Mycena epipterygia]